MAHRGQWAEAKTAFEQALEAIGGTGGERTVTSVANDDDRARLLLNIGQSFFHLGSFEESRRFAERSCAIRVSLYGEDSLVVARTRSDLAVILAASGHTDEAMSLLGRAVLAVERQRGPQSTHLVPLLTNAARLLARSDADRAQPYVARLKAMMFAQQLAQNAENFPRSELPAHSFVDTPTSKGSDDHYLRAAVAQTVDLLRSTPTANIAALERRKVFETPSLVETVVTDRQSEPESAHEFFSPLDSLDDASKLEPLPVEQNVAAETPLDEVVTAEIPIDVNALPEDPVDDRENVSVMWEYDAPLPPTRPPEIVAIAEPVQADDRLFDLVEPPPPTLSVLPDAATRAAERAKVNPLGFDVEYGIPSQMNESLANPTTPLPAEPAERDVSESNRVQSLPPARAAMRAVGGARRGRAEFIATKRLWIIGAGVAAFGGGIGAFFLYSYLQKLFR